METIAGVIGVIIIIIIEMIFGRIMDIVGLVIEVIVKFFRKLF